MTCIWRRDTLPLCWEWSRETARSSTRAFGTGPKPSIGLPRPPYFLPTPVSMAQMAASDQPSITALMAAGATGHYRTLILSIYDEAFIRHYGVGWYNFGATPREDGVPHQLIPLYTTLVDRPHASYAFWSHIYPTATCRRHPGRGAVHVAWHQPSPTSGLAAIPLSPEGCNAPRLGRGGGNIRVGHRNPYDPPLTPEGYVPPDDEQDIDAPSVGTEPAPRGEAEVQTEWGPRRQLFASPSMATSLSTEDISPEGPASSRRRAHHVPPIPRCAEMRRSPSAASLASVTREATRDPTATALGVVECLSSVLPH